MGTDALESMGQSVQVRSNTMINLEVDTAAEATRLQGLGDGGSVAVKVQTLRWGHGGCVRDRSGIRWMFSTGRELTLYSSVTAAVLSQVKGPAVGVPALRGCGLATLSVVCEDDDASVLGPM